MRVLAFQSNLRRSTTMHRCNNKKYLSCICSNTYSRRTHHVSRGIPLRDSCGRTDLCNRTISVGARKFSPILQTPQPVIVPRAIRIDSIVCCCGAPKNFGLIVGGGVVLALFFGITTRSQPTTAIEVRVTSWIRNNGSDAHGTSGVPSRAI